MNDWHSEKFFIEFYPFQALRSLLDDVEREKWTTWHYQCITKCRVLDATKKLPIIPCLLMV